MATGNMYAEVSQNTNLKSLADLQGINSITHTANGLLASISDAKKRERRIEYFYDNMLLDTIKLGSENNVFLKYCKVKAVPKGNEKFLLRRWGGLTEHTYPLAEGVPPKSDMMASEQFEGTFQQFGRYMEFTDRVEFNLIDDVIAHYSMELGDVAVRTAERLCREELIANAGEIYPDAKTFDKLVVGDTVGIADYRLQALKFSRRLVKPINGSYHIICSPEHIYDLVEDPLVEKYMEWSHNCEPYMTGKPFNLFNLTFEETMLDDYAYGYTEMSNPGEYDVNPTTKGLRLVILTADGKTYYKNVKHGDSFGTTVSRTVVKDSHLKDGSYIPERVVWNVEAISTAIVGKTGLNLSVTDDKGATQSLATGIVEVRQLPVHRSFMFGDEFIYKTGIDGEMAAKFYVKEKGSAGVLDPIDQRQSVGFKINALGFNTVRPEAMVQFIFVPKHALDTYDVVLDEFEKHYN